MTFEDRFLAAQSDAIPWMRGFLDELLKTEGDTDAAAASVNVTVPELHRLRAVNKVLCAEWDKVLRAIRSIRAQRLESIAYHEAAFPQRKYKFTPAGEPVTHPETNDPYFEYDRDNRLVMSLLKALDRETYADRQIVTGEGGGPIQHTHLAATFADIVRIAKLLEDGKISPTEPVGEIVDGEIIDESAGPDE